MSDLKDKILVMIDKEFIHEEFAPDWPEERIERFWDVMKEEISREIWAHVWGVLELKVDEWK
jgi:hypothetical protein